MSTRLTDQMLIGIVSTMAVVVVGGSWHTYGTVQALIERIESQNGRVARLEVRLDAVQAQMVTQAQLLETLKRVEQQLEIIRLKGLISSEVKVE